DRRLELQTDRARTKQWHDRLDRTPIERAVSPEYDARMGVSFLIIDGYNLLHAVGLGRARYGPGQLEKQRQRLLAFLAEHVSAIQRLRTTVVFDARDAPPGLARHAVHAEMEIVFARPGEEADPLIEELIAA